jgi:UDP-N-acetylglucosamine--N-acetylmuramyl-(pentapeptide) pyrophosphoryl-undecaprenol N-acetylglucosamine transferase
MAKKIIIAAGGTGGHIFPAQALTEHLLAKGLKPILVCDERTGQFLQGALKDIPQYRMICGKLTGSLPRKFISLSKLAISILQVLAFLIKEKPALVIGFGGYPSFPTIMAAKMLGIKAVICEQNAVLGRVNKIAASFVEKICTTFPDTKGIKDKHKNKVVITGTPVRKDILKGKKDPSNKFHLLIIGGSQGARILSQIVPKAISHLPKAIQSQLIITQQAQPDLAEEVLKSYGSTSCQVEIKPFFQDIAKRIYNADLLICRAGASTIAEVTTVGKAAIFIPYALAMDNHQYYNALNLVKIDAAKLIEEKDLSAQNLADIIQHFIVHPKELQEYAVRAKTLSQAKAVVNIYNVIKALI